MLVVSLRNIGGPTAKILYCTVDRSTVLSLQVHDDVVLMCICLIAHLERIKMTTSTIRVRPAVVARVCVLVDIHLREY